MHLGTTTTAATFEIPFLRFLDEQSQLTQPLPEFATPQTLVSLYRLLSLLRVLDNKAVNLQRTGKMSTYPAARGQEAVSIGMGHALEKGDVFCPYYRDQGVFLTRGLKISEIILPWGGHEKGHAFTHPDLAHDFPICVPIATQLLHATGVAFALQYQQKPSAVLTVCGDGGTSKGDFYEALNLAGAENLPVVFVVNNNQWAISVSRATQTSAPTLAQKAIAGGMPGIQVDGNDVIAVRHVVAEALQKARAGGGPTLIEALTYRLCDHTTADDAKRYQPADEVKTAWKSEPIARLGYYLEAQGLWSREKEAALAEVLAYEVDQGVQEYLQVEDPAPTDMFDYLYATLPKGLQAQRQQAEMFHGK
ncbi:MAG: pyruvate dehydrogenase (acetyl-transferring) E1 component subunit alpha [Gammaproteobacteria bacterium RIFCSPHIGHO2_12_FULL_45_9]|nr:MAG: pyruvate dehydrogenase (acetyl-transferring) E1 component subunit alpha [Gammaproteobacteria bacterium RIFCSPHIGHO2_12_FULL_45_9]